MTALRTYAQELAAVEAVLRPRRVEAREWARPDAWDSLFLMSVPGDGYSLYGTSPKLSDVVFVGGRDTSRCFACSAIWQELPCKHQLGLAALWAGGHPIAGTPNFHRARKLEGGAL